MRSGMSLHISLIRRANSESVLSHEDSRREGWIAERPH
jgi:hypothetical protein